MSYGTIKVDTITFTNSGVDQSITVSGIVGSISGNITATGTVQANVVIGTTLVSGGTVTGDAGAFNSLTGNTAGFATVSGATVTGNVGSFGTITGGTVTLISGVFASGSAAAPSVSVGTTDNGIYSPGADQVAISTNGAQALYINADGDILVADGNRMEIDEIRARDGAGLKLFDDAGAGIFVQDGGNVGLGTSSPDELLHIQGDTAEFKGTNTNQIADTAGTEQVFKFGIEGQKNNVYGPAGSIIFRQDGTTWSSVDQYNKATRLEFCTQDNSTSDTSETPRLVIDKDGNVGVGTSSPASLLHLSGANVDTALKIQAGTAVPAIELIRGSNSIFGADTTYDYRLKNEAGDFTLQNGVNSTITDLVTVTATGNVGVGTTSPTFGSGSGIEIERVSENATLRVERTTTNTSAVELRAGENVGVLETRLNKDLAFGTNSAERARIDSSGRLLVGTSSSLGLGYRLQVAGIDDATSSLSLHRYQANANASLLEFRKSRGASVGTDAVVSSGDNLGSVVARGYDGASYIQAARIDVAVDGTPGANDMPGRLVFSTTADGASSPTERMRISNNGNIGLNYTSANNNDNLTIGDITNDTASTQRFIAIRGNSSSSATNAVTGFSLNGWGGGANGGTPYTTSSLRGVEVSSYADHADQTVTDAYAFYVTTAWGTVGTNSYGYYSLMNNGYGFYSAGTADNYFAGKIASLGSYNDTTASAANVFIASNGDIQRSTSSIRYKTDVEDLDTSYADNVILNARPVWYRSLCEADNAGWSYYGLIAEEVAELDPRLVFWGRPTKEVISEEAKLAVFDDDGNEIEPAREAVYTNVEDTDAELRPEGVQYDRLTVMLIDVVQRQQKTIEALEARVAALETP